jgi:hypothetical protein
MFTGRLPLPAYPLGQRKVNLNGSRPGAGPFATPRVPALLRKKDKGRLAFHRIGDQHVRLADIDTLVAAVADLWVKGDRVAGRAPVRKGINFFLIHGHLSFQPFDWVRFTTTQELCSS